MGAYQSKNIKGKVRTHCKYGHELSPDNVYIWISKQNHTMRECKICATDKNHRRKKQLRDNHLQRKFGISIDEFGKKLSEQGNKCAICKSEYPGGNRSFHVDHNHSTGQVRKLLCQGCNAALGYARENPEILREMIKYLYIENSKYSGVW